MSNKKQQKLSFFMSKSKQGNDDNESGGEERPPPTTSSGEERPPPTTEKASKEVLSGQPKRTYLPKWQRIYSWLEYDDKVQLMTCRICKSKGRKNVFTTGSSNFKTSTLEDHQKTKDHQTAMIAPMLEKHMEKAQNKAQSDAEKGVLVALEAAYFLASENIALVKFKALIQFLRRVKAANINHLKLSDNTLYESSYSANEFVDAIAKVLEMELESKLAASPAVTVLADESTDIAVNKRLVLYAQITNPQTMQVSTEYITNVKITEGTGEAIADEIYRQLALRGVASDKIMGLGSDGASVMTGKGKGVTGMMLRKNPHLVNVHCVAHRLALCTSQAAENLPALKDFQETITAIYYYFKYSSCKQSKLAAIEKVLNTPQLKYKEVHSVRWLSFFDALETVFRTLEPLLTYLADTTLKDPKAVHLKKKVASVKFISLTYIMMDIIPHVSKLSLFFQKENVDLALVKVNIDHCVTDLQQLLTECGPHEKQLEEHLQQQTGLFFGHEVTGCPEDHVHSAKQKFIDKLVANINERFTGTDLMTAFGVLSMRPISFLSAEELEVWGNEQIKQLTDHYGNEKTHSWKEENMTMATTSKPVIDPEATHDEWKNIKPKTVALLYPRDKTSSLWSLINQYHKDEYPNLVKLAHLALTCPIHTSGCERGFSIQNSILTSTRNRLTPELQNTLIRIKAAGQDLSEFDFSAALKCWRNQRKRKILT